MTPIPQEVHKDHKAIKVHKVQRVRQVIWVREDTKDIKVHKVRRVKKVTLIPLQEVRVHKVLEEQMEVFK